MCKAGTLRAHRRPRPLLGIHRLVSHTRWPTLHAFGAIPSASGSDVERLDTVLRAVLTKVDASSLVVIEDFAFASGNRAHQLGGLGYLVRHALWKNGIPFIVVGPKQRAKFCTGNGNARKEHILKYVEKNFGIDTDDHNAADACVLNFIGQSLLGWYQPKLEFQKEILQTIRDSYVSGGARGKIKKGLRWIAHKVAAQKRDLQNTVRGKSS